LKVKAARFAASWLAAFASLLASPFAASADEFRTPSISTVRVEWRAVLEQLRAEINTQPSIAANFTFAGQRCVPSDDPRSSPALVQLNAITWQLFPGIGRSPIPVLLPFDTASYLVARQGGAPETFSVPRHQARLCPLRVHTAS
jgi:hypothetical protein